MAAVYSMASMKLERSGFSHPGASSIAPAVASTVTSPARRLPSLFLTATAPPDNAAAAFKNRDGNSLDRLCQFSTILSLRLRTALINSVSQTLDVRETGDGLGLFNLITFILGAVGTALVVRGLVSGWFDVGLNPLITESRAFSYSNLMRAFALLIAAPALPSLSDISATD